MYKRLQNSYFPGESPAIGTNPAFVTQFPIQVNATNLILRSLNTQLKFLAWGIWPGNVARNTDFSSFTSTLQMYYLVSYTSIWKMWGLFYPNNWSKLNPGASWASAKFSAKALERWPWNDKHFQKSRETFTALGRAPPSSRNKITSFLSKLSYLPLT